VSRQTQFPRYDIGQVVVLKHNGRPYKIRAQKYVRTHVQQNSYVEYVLCGIAEGTNVFYEDELRPLNPKEIGTDWSRL
jgi:hypothetical protein